MSSHLDVALELADIADAITMARFRAPDLRVDTKSDRTPVTDADRATEQALRDALQRLRPGQEIVGEEFGGARAGGVAVDPRPDRRHRELRQRCPGLGDR